MWKRRKHKDPDKPTDADWKAYIDVEVRAVCEEKGWRHQVRRKWSVREKSVPESPIEDYEWKLVPNSNDEPPDAQSDFGTYYVLAFDQETPKFVFQHDTVHVGMWGPHWETSTYTEIDFNNPTRFHRRHHGQSLDLRLEAGWLRDHLLRLVQQYDPNSFSAS